MSLNSIDIDTRIPRDPAAGRGDFRRAKAFAILRSAERQLDPIGNVLSSPPVYTAGADFANSTIIASATVNLGAGRFNSENPLHAKPIGGAFIDGNLQTITRGGSPTPPRSLGHSTGISFATRASVLDIAVRSGRPFIGYVTDLATGARARILANDTSPAGGSGYQKFDFGSAAPRGFQFYIEANGYLRGINVPLTDSIWPWEPDAQPKIMALWDSYGAGVVHDGVSVTSLKLGVLDYLGERLGCDNVVGNAVGGTGLLNPGSGHRTFLERLAAGDFDESFIGAQDLIIMPGTVNDSAILNAAYTDAAVKAAYTTSVRMMMAAQPNAVIVGCGPQVATAFPAVQSRFDAYKAGFAAAGNDPRLIYIDNGPTGENWLFAGNIGTLGAADNIHLKSIGVQYLGYRMADSIVAAIKSSQLVA